MICGAMRITDLISDLVSGLCSTALYKRTGHSTRRIRQAFRYLYGQSGAKARALEHASDEFPYFPSIHH